MKLKEEENVKRKIPKFPQVRKNVYRDICPKVKMSFMFRNRNDGSIKISTELDHTPLNKFQRDPLYEKLYEEAHIEVKRKYLNCSVTNTLLVQIEL